MAIGANLTKREQTLLAVAAFAVLLLGAYWYFIYSPKSAELEALRIRIGALEQANQQARADMAQGSVERLREEVARDARTLAIMQSLVPARNEVPALLEDISTSARRVGLDLATVEPLPVIPGEDFDTYRYRIAVIGHYHAIAQLLTNVGSLRRIVAPVTLEVKPHAAARRAGQQSRATPERPNLETTFQIQTYVSRALPAEGLAAGQAGREPGT